MYLSSSSSIPILYLVFKIRTIKFAFINQFYKSIFHMLPHYIHSVNYLPIQFCGALRRTACPAGIGFEFCGYCEKAVISLMKWIESREKPP